MDNQYFDEENLLEFRIPKWKGKDLKDDVENMIKIKISGCDALSDKQRKITCKEVVYNQAIEDLKTKSLLCKTTKCTESISSTISKYVNKLQQLYG